MTSPARELRGVLPVFQTPYHSNETIDFATLEREIAWLHDCGAHGIVMAMVSETLGLALPGSATLPAVAPERSALSRRAGRTVMDLLKKGGPRPRDLVTRKSLENACAAVAATGLQHAVLTGRNAADEVIAAADLVTEMTLVKHPFRAGIKGQPGVEF